MVACGVLSGSGGRSPAIRRRAMIYNLQILRALAAYRSS